MPDVKLEPLLDDKSGQPKEPPQPPPPAPRTPKHALSEPERHATRILNELRLRVDEAQQKIASGDAAGFDEAALQAKIESLIKNRNDLNPALAALPTGDPLMTQIFQAQDDATAVIARLDQLSKAAHAKTTTAPTAVTGDNEKILQAAASKGGAGYCDTDGKGDSAHCSLQPAERTHYRARVVQIVDGSTMSWTAAINAKQVEERIKNNEISFEQQLGQMLLGLMFSGFSAAAKYGIGKGVDKAADKLTTKTPLAEHEVKIGPSDDVIDGAKSGLQAASKKGISAVEKAATSAGGGHKTAQQVNDEAVVAAPADRTAFLQVLKSAPTAWRNSILGNLPYLYDEDLAALYVGLPAASPSQADFENWIDSMLQRYDQQVTTVNRDVRPIQVVAADGRLRHALVATDQKPDSSLKGEWRNSLVPTGKMRFVRWVDEDMAGMAQQRAGEMNSRHMMQEARRFDDAVYWSDESLANLAESKMSSPATGNPLVADSSREIR